MVQYGRVNLYCVRLVFLIYASSVIYGVMQPTPDYFHCICNAAVCGLCLLAKPIATYYHGTSNIRFIY